MKKTIMIVSFLLAVSLVSSAQPCLPQGVIFTQQYQIDAFQFNNPGCTEIEGSVTIHGSNITNLTGLNVLTKIYGNLQIVDNDILTNLTGLEGITTVNGNVSVGNSYYGGNPILTSLNGLNNLSHIGGDLLIFSNNAFSNLSGIDELSFVGGNFIIDNNTGLLNLSGVAGINFIGGSLTIINNSSLVNLSGLEDLPFFGGDLIIGNSQGGNSSLVNLTGLGNTTVFGGMIQIYNNDALNSLEGLENLDIASVTSLLISGNNSLSVCNTPVICDLLANPDISVIFYNNAPGCNTSSQVAYACGISIPCLSDGKTFDSQAEIDNFPVSYPGCTEIGGTVYISGPDITNLNGLNEVTSIDGSLFIGFYIAGNNPLLTNLEGLNNLSHIGGSLFIYTNQVLKNVDALENLTSIEGELIIESNDSLSSLQGFSNLNTIGMALTIVDNNMLQSLSGLENIDEQTIEHLTIYYNNQLSYCAIESVCECIPAPGLELVISNNAPGCNNPAEVLAMCSVGLEESAQSQTQPVIHIYPNPSNSTFTIEYQGASEYPATISFLDNLGRQIRVFNFISANPGKNPVIWEASGLPEGVYFYRVQSGIFTETGRLMLMK